MKTLIIIISAILFSAQLFGVPFGPCNVRLPFEYGTSENETLNDWEEFNELPQIDEIVWTDNNQVPKTDYKCTFTYNSEGQIIEMYLFEKKQSSVSWYHNSIFELSYTGKLVTQVVFSGLMYSVELERSLYGDVFIYECDEFGNILSSSYESIWADSIVWRGEYSTYQYDSRGNVTSERTDVTQTIDFISNSYLSSTSTKEFEYDEQNRVVKELLVDESFNNDTMASTTINYTYTAEMLDGVEMNVKMKTSDALYDGNCVGYGGRVGVYGDSIVRDYTVVKEYCNTSGHVVRKEFVSTLYDIIERKSVFEDVITNEYGYDEDIVMSKKVTRNMNNEGAEFWGGYTYSYNEAGQIVQSTDPWDTYTINYRVAPQPSGLSLESNKISIPFNYRLDTAVDYQSMIAIEVTALKSDGLTIKDVYVSPTDAKVLVIELNRAVAVGEGFEIYSTQDLPMADGRLAPLSITAQGLNTATESVSNSPSVVSQSSGSVTVSDADGLQSAQILSLSGTVISQATGGAEVITVETSGVPSGIYILSVTDAAGNSSTQKIILN